MNQVAQKIPANAPRIRNDFVSAASDEDSRRRKRPSPITWRVTEEERKRLKSLAEGMPVSAYIRQCVFGKDAARRKRRSHTPARDQEALAKILAMLGASRIANNLNQLAYHANTGSLLLDEHTLGQINEAYDHVCTMREALIRTLGLIEDGNQ